MSWNVVTIPRRRSGVGMPERCVYCNASAEQDLTLRSHRETGRTRGTVTTTHIEEHLAIEVPYCRTHAARSARLKNEIEYLVLGAAGGFALLAFALVLIGLDAPVGVRVFIGVLAAVVIGILALLAAGSLIRKLPRYRDWGAGMLGIDMAAGDTAFTFRFTNPTYAAQFRTRNGQLG